MVPLVCRVGPAFEAGPLGVPRARAADPRLRVQREAPV